MLTGLAVTIGTPIVMLLWSLVGSYAKTKLGI